MNTFAAMLLKRVEGYIELRRSLGLGFRKQGATLRRFQRYVAASRLEGPLTQDMALAFSLASSGTANGRECRYGVIRRFSEYLAIFDPRTQRLEPRVLPRSRAIPPPRILSGAELAAVISACARITPDRPYRGRTLAMVIGLLASTGLRSGEALRFDRADVDLSTGVLHIRKTKFRKDRLVPVHPTTLAALRRYARSRDITFPVPRSPAFFLSMRGNRLSTGALYGALSQACDIAELNQSVPRALRLHDLRHRFAVTRLAEWHRQKADVQAQLPLLATYLGHARYSDTAYYVTATPELLGLAAQRAFGQVGGAP
jgi:integrase